MASTITESSPARTLQTKIDKLHAEMHDTVARIVTAGGVAKNAPYEKRQSIFQAAIKSGELPRTFWAEAIIAALDSSSNNNNNDEIENNNNKENEYDDDDDDEEGGKLLGAYDAALLREYLQEMQVQNTEEGFRIILTFNNNPYFEETQLWAETVVIDDSCKFSGVTWKPGHGPKDMESDEDEEDEEENDERKNERKREREGDNNNNNNNKTITQGWSFLDVFSEMLPHPEENESFLRKNNNNNNNDDDDEEDEEEDDEMLAEAVDKWEAEMEDRRDLLMLLVEDVWADPIAAITKKKISTNNNNNNNNNEAGQAAQRRRTE